MTKWLLIVAIAAAGCTLPVTTHAEYRAFELVITDSESGKERTEVSTLTPVQYRAYHPIKATEKVTYRATWMCFGNTAYKPVCRNPKQ